MTAAAAIGLRRGEHDMVSRWAFSICAGVLAAFVLLPAQVVRAGEDTETDFEAEYRKKLREVEQKSLEQRAANAKAVDALIQQMKDEREKNAAPLKGEVEIDGEKKEVVEPRTMEQALGFTGDRRVRDEYEVSPDDFDITPLDRWSLNLSDFKIDDPQYVTVEHGTGHAKTYFGITFSITNSTTKPRRISPTFTAVTDNLVFNATSGGFLAERVLADAMFRPLGGSDKLADKELLSQNIAALESVADLITVGTEKPGAVLKPTYTFEPGQTRWGAALWGEFDNRFRELKIIVSGLSNAHRYDEKMRRVLVLTFERLSDGYNVSTAQLKYKGKKWDYLWTWDQDIAVPIPDDAKDPQIKAQKLPTPAGGERFTVAFPFVVSNSTKVNQEFAIKTVAYVAPVEVDVGGTKVKVDVRLIDDGSSKIYKAQVMKGLSVDFVKDRYQNKALVDGSLTALDRHKVTIEPGKSLDKMWAIFDEGDVDWDNAIMSVEDSLSRSFDRAAMSKQAWEKLVKELGGDAKLAEKNPSHFYEPRRTLNSEEIKSVREQIVKALPEAVERAKAAKSVTAIFDCFAGMASGEKRIIRSYRKPGVVDNTWLKDWEDIEEKPK